LVVPHQFSQVVSEWLENQILIPDWNQKILIRNGEGQQKIKIVRTNFRFAGFLPIKFLPASAPPLSAAEKNQG